MVLQRNLVSGCAFILPFSVPNFKGIGNAFVFYNNFHTLTKRRRKNEETKPIFEGSYLRNTQCDLVEIWNVRWWHLPVFTMQNSFGFVKLSLSYICMNIALLLTGMARRLLGPHDTLLCVLIYSTVQLQLDIYTRFTTSHNAYQL